MGRSRTVETPFGAVEFSFDEQQPAPTRDEVERESVVQTITYCLDTRDPEVRRAVLELFCEQRRWQMPFGFDVHELREEHVEAMRDELRVFVEHGAARGAIRFRELKTFVAAKGEKTAEIVPELQPLAEQSPTEQDVCLPCQQRAAASAQALRAAAASGVPFVG